MRLESLHDACFGHLELRPVRSRKVRTMELVSKRVYEILKNKGVETLHHANSIITSCQFLRTASLVSRGTAHRKALYQTPQKSDGIDKTYAIWFDIFTDSVDIHARGPSLTIMVLFNSFLILN